MKPSFPRAFTIFRWLIPSAVCGLSAGAAPLYKVNNSDDLNLLTSWSTTSGAQAPNPGVLDPSDIWYFNEVTMLGSKTVSLGGNMTIAGIGLDYATANSANDLVINAGGTLTLNGGTIHGNGVHLVGGSYATAGIVLNRALGGTLTINSNVAIGANQQWVNSRVITVGGGVNLNDKTLSFNTAGTSVTTLSGLISGTGALNKATGTGTLALTGVANTFSGSVTGVGGTLSVTKLADTGTPSSIGTGTGSAPIILNGGTLTYTGAGGDSTNRAIDMRAGAAINNNSATGAISFTAANVIQGGAASARTLTLGGTNTGNNTFSSILGNSGTAANISTLQKSGAGSWIIGGTQAYTGATIINQGTLRVGGSAVLGGDAAATGGTTDTGNIWFTSTNANAALEFETAANLGPAAQIRFRNTGGTAGQGGVLKYVGTTAQTVSKTIQCDTTIGIRLESDSAGGSITFNGTFNQVNRPLYLGGTGTGDNRLDIAFTGTGTLVKRDAGTWILGSANTHTGTTTVSGGRLVIAGSTAAAGLIQVSASATLGGGGSGGDTTLVDNATLAPGHTGDNHQTLAGLTLSGGSILSFDLAAPLANPFDTVPDAASDHVRVTTNALMLDGILRINALPGFGAPVAGNRWLLMTADGGLADNTLAVDTINSPALSGGLSYEIDTDTVPGLVYLQVVPEAGTAGLVALGLLLLRRRRA